MSKYILYVNGMDRGVFYANNDDIAYSKGEFIASMLGYYVPDDVVEVERI